MTHVKMALLHNMIYVKPVKKVISINLYAPIINISNVSIHVLFLYVKVNSKILLLVTFILI